MTIKLLVLGKTDSTQLNQLIEEYQNRLKHYIKFELEIIPGLKQLVFVIGGPYGFSDAVYQKSQGKISLSKMTFSHQMVRLFMVEQLYRAFTILRNEPYHHQ